MGLLMIRVLFLTIEISLFTSSNVPTLICKLIHAGALAMKISVDFSGGTEIFFGNKSHLDVDLPEMQTEVRMKDLLKFLSLNYLKVNISAFMDEDTIKPGLLVLVNDCDWELMDREQYMLKEGDKIDIISTLHGG